MFMSSILPQCGALPGGITLSTTRTLPPFAIAFLQCERICFDCASLQSWRMYFMM